MKKISVQTNLGPAHERDYLGVKGPDQVAENFSDFVHSCLIKPQTHEVDPQSVGKEVHLKKPLCFGGHWNDHANVVLVTPVQHAELARYWNKLYRDLLTQQMGST
jgi:hypothetical protein